MSQKGGKKTVQKKKKTVKKIQEMMETVQVGPIIEALTSAAWEQHVHTLRMGWYL